MTERAGRVGGGMGEQGRGDRRPLVVRVGRESGIAAALGAVAIRLGQPVLVLVGGADGMDDEHLRMIDVVLREAILPVVIERGALVLDGGTDSGVMRVVGQVRSAMGAGFPLVGVAAAEMVVLPGEQRRATAQLERHHTHALLVPGVNWGDESGWLAAVADVVADALPSVTVLVNGGEVAYDDVSASLASDRPVVVLAGTGRTADAIAEVAVGRVADRRAVVIARSELTRVVPVTDLAAIRAAIETALS